MKTAISIAFLSLLVAVSIPTSCSSPNGQQVPDPIQTPTVQPQLPPTPTQEPDPVQTPTVQPQSDTGESIEVISVNVENVSDTGKDMEVVYRSSNPRPPYSDRSVFDYDYDDSWVANIPEVIGGYEVIRVETPNKVACMAAPMITLQFPKPNQVVAPDLRALIRAILGVPSDFNLSFANANSITDEEYAENLEKSNEASLKDGCIVLGGPGGGTGLTDEQVEAAIAAQTPTPTPIIQIHDYEVGGGDDR